MSSNVRFMSSIIASSEPPADASTPATTRGVLSSSVSPIDCASRRAGSMVSTHTRRPRSAALSASAAAVVVLPTPPAPQHTTIEAVSSSSSTSKVLTKAPSPQPSVLQVAGQLVETGQVGRSGQHRQLDGGLADRTEQPALALLEQDAVRVVGGLAGECRQGRVGCVDAGRLQSPGQLTVVDAAGRDV